MKGILEAMMLVNLGCGNRFNKGLDWVNIDFTSLSPLVQAHDLREGIPLPDRCADIVYHSHLLEHFTKQEAQIFVAECRRVLQAGGVLRVVVPDLEGITRAYLKSLDDARAGVNGASARHEWMVTELLDQMVREKSGGEMLEYLSRETIPAEAFILERLGVEAKRIIEGVRASNAKGRTENIGGYLDNIKSLVASALKGGKDPDAKAAFRKSGEVHRWMYDSLSLRKLLEDAGFVGVVQRTAAESYIQGWEGNNLDTEPDGSVYKPDSLFMEGRRPRR